MYFPLKKIQNTTLLFNLHFNLFGFVFFMIFLIVDNLFLLLYDYINNSLEEEKVINLTRVHHLVYRFGVLTRVI